MCNQQLFTIIINNSIKDDAVDIILSLEYITGFTLSKAFGFSRKHAKYDIKEQVEGYKDFYRIDIAHEPKDLDHLLQAFSQLSGQFKLKYWVMPLIDCGEI